nr:hypothetical protein [Tanacetum cinerariifolium]
MPANASPTTRLPGYIADNKPIKDDPEKDPEMDPVDYPFDEEDESFEDEEPLASVDFASPIPNSAPSSEETEPFKTDETATTPPPPVSPHTIVPLSSTKEVKESVTDIAFSHRQDSEEFHTRHQDAQDDKALLRARISTLVRESRYYRHMAIVADQEAIYL